MEINDLVWILYSGLLNKELIINKSKEFKGNDPLKIIFQCNELNLTGVNINDLFSFYKFNEQCLNAFNNKLLLLLNESPHNLRLLSIYLIDFFVSHFESLIQRKDYPRTFAKKNLFSKLDLPPIPYINGCDDFLYLFNLKLVCNYGMDYKDWVDIFSKLENFLRNGKVDFMSFRSFTTPFICPLMKDGDFFSNNQNLVSYSYLNILDNDFIIRNFYYVSMLVHGLKLLKRIETKKVGEIYIKYAIYVLCESFKRVDEEIQEIGDYREMKFISIIYCLVSLSISSNRIDSSIVCIENAQRLLRSNKEMLNTGTTSTLNIYILLAKLHILLIALEKSENSIFNSIPINKATNLNLLVITTFKEIRNEVIRCAGTMNNTQCIKLLRHITKYANHIFENFPVALSMNCGDGGLSNDDVTKMWNLCLSESSSNCKIQNKPQILPDACDLFSYLTEGRISYKNNHIIFRIHCSICWENIIPNMLLKISDTAINYNQDFFSFHLSHLAEQLIEYAKLMYEIPIEGDKYCLSRFDFAEIYLFVSLYLYFGKGDTCRSIEYIKCGKDMLNPCNYSFECCSIQCILLYLELIISISTLEEFKIESILMEMLSFGKKSLYFVHPKTKELNRKRKLVNYSVIQGYTLLSLLRNDCHLFSDEELKFLLNTEDTRGFSGLDKPQSMENDILGQNYMNIVCNIKGVTPEQLIEDRSNGLLLFSPCS